MSESLPESIEREHIYDAQTSVLAARLVLPSIKDIEPLGVVSLLATGGYFQKAVEPFKVGFVLSFESGYSQVAGHGATLPCKGFVTYANAVIEGLNIFDVVTVDRIVSQVTTIHPLVGYVPTVSFLGTRFENLRIGGRPVEVDLDWNSLGSKPEDGEGYATSPELLSRVERQCDEVRQHRSLPREMEERYNRLPTGTGDSLETQGMVECSLVNHVEDRGSGVSPLLCHGHVIKIPHFGVLELGRVTVQQSDYDPYSGVPKSTVISLSMLDLTLTCANDGRFRCCDLIVNGRGKP